MPSSGPAGLKRELGLRDLVLTQILFVVGLTNFGNSAKLGASHVVFWLTAIVLFYIPQAMVVIHLNRWLPLEGGLYQWARAAFGDLAGFLVAWNLWIYAMVLMSEIGITTVTNLAYAIGPSALWLADNKLVVALATAILIFALAAVSILGLGVGKWIYNLGGITVLVLLGALLTAYLVPHQRPTLSLAIPPLTLLNLNILGKLAFFALGGFEYVAVFAGECRDPERLIAKSVMASINFAVNSRLPMVAGWDHLLPAWFTRLHPTRRTPINSALFVAALTLALALAGIAGAGRQEAFQLLQNASAIFYGLTYLVMFAIPILGLAAPSVSLRLAAASGFVMTLLCVVLSIFPIISVPNRLIFTLKVSCAVIGCNVLGALIYRFQTRRFSH